MQTETLGRILVELGGGRKITTDQIDKGVGMIFHKKLGNKVQSGEPLVSVFAPEGMDLKPIEDLFYDSIEISSSRKPVPKLILEQLS